MEDTKKIYANGKEFVIMSVDGYKKLANIDKSGENLYWTTDLNKEMPIKMKMQNEDGSELLFPKTIPQVFYENLQNYPELPSLHTELSPGKWNLWTWKECWDISFAFAKSCIAFGVNHRAAVNIIGFNCAEWIWSFYGAILAD